MSWPLHKNSCRLQLRLLTASRVVNPHTDRIIKSLQSWARSSTSLLSLIILPTLLSGAFHTWVLDYDLHLTLQLSGWSRQKEFTFSPLSLSFSRVHQAMTIGSDSTTVPALGLQAEASNSSLGKRNVVLRVENEIIYLRVLVDVHWSTLADASRESWLQALQLWTMVFQGPM